MTRYESGLEGERAAAEYLRQAGYTVMETRYRTAGGEVDLIALEGGVLSFIEVKYRPDSRLGMGLAAITPQKLARIRGAAAAYLAGKPAPYRVAFLEITRAGVLFRPDVLNET